MKFLKYSILLLIFSFIMCFTIVKAYPSPDFTAYTLELDKNNSQTMAYRTKYDYSKQKYENKDSFTWLTDPCTSCQITTKLVGTDASFLGITTVMGQTKYFTQNSGSPADYQLMVWRNDTTLLTTYHSSIWHINNVS